MEADVADVAKLIEEHLQHRCNCVLDESGFAKCLSIADKYAAHGMGVVIEELMTWTELTAYQHSLG
jgi:hypothetical protein